MKMAIGLTMFWIAVLSVLNPPEVAANTAQVKAWCYSVAMEEASTSEGETIYFTTYDGKSGEPLHDEADGYWTIGMEMMPQTLGSLTYLSDYIVVDNLGYIYEYGSLSLSLSTLDSNSNGVLDFLEKSLSAKVAFTGRATPDWNGYGPFVNSTVTGSLTRSANSSTGSYSGTFKNSKGSATFAGSWDIPSVTGTVTYIPGGQSVQVDLTYSDPQETNEYAGTVTVSIQSEDQIILNSFILSDSAKDRTLRVNTATLQRSGKYYRGNIAAEDGNFATSWRDYYNYRFEIYDPSDWDNDGVPDLTDPKPHIPPNPVTKSMPWLPLLLDN